MSVKKTRNQANSEEGHGQADTTKTVMIMIITESHHLWAIPW